MLRTFTGWVFVGVLVFCGFLAGMLYQAKTRVCPTDCKSHSTIRIYATDAGKPLAICKISAPRAAPGAHVLWGWLF
jgi:hypothetical protein